jgi:hypothetical protein
MDLKLLCTIKYFYVEYKDVVFLWFVAILVRII